MSLMARIDEIAMQRYATIPKASDALELKDHDYYRLRSRDISRFSIAKLLMVLDKLGAKVTITVTTD